MLEEYGRVFKLGKVALLLEKGMKGIVTPKKEVGKCVTYWIGKWWQKRKKFCMD